MIHVEKVSKVFRVHKKKVGLWASLRSVVKREWVDRHALRNVDLTVNTGEIVGLIGANGAGKTTLIKILAGIIPASSGSARVLDFDPWERRIAYRKQIALIMGQKAQLWWDLPAADCFLLLREIYQVPRDEFDARLKDLCTRLEVRDQLQVPIRRLSLGERMKMELMAALLHNPKVIFLDEPTIGLDISAQRAIREFVKDYRKAHSPAIIVTSHYMEDIEELCERVVIIRDGSFVYDGSLARIKEEYAPHKIIVGRRGVGETQSWGQFQLPSNLGEVLEQNEQLIRVKVQRDRVSEVASRLLSTRHIGDLLIEEPDVASIVDSIYKRKIL